MLVDVNPVVGLTGLISIAESYVETYNFEFQVSLHHNCRLCCSTVKSARVGAGYGRKFETYRRPRDGAKEEMFVSINFL